ncbi:alkylhydroperoxidase domain protein [Corynebacterium breve]|uniref:Alkylhydroperoxidase domain protein n=1 Tax=Corynebacterium breve TaxID=3049799 RepID=A0ABY8VF79_9CORY|nr:alkylhydroperoxidase domain protein [Corynebacterium breve]WIM67762.1 alkylhydroperoxidase domain protein [Corynebacterium breve]
MTDIIDLLTNNQFATIREARPNAKANAQRSFDVLFDDPNALPERYAVAEHVARLHDTAVDFYAELAEEDPATDPARKDAAIKFADLLVLRPADATAADVGALLELFDENEIVTLAQLISFLSFQLRVVHGIQTIGGLDVASTGGRGPIITTPHEFSTAQLGWKPWVKDLKKSELTAEHHEALIKPERANMPYFRLLVRNPQALKARTLTDLDIFYNIQGGLSRAERELAATITSRLNGCPYCASVHQQRAKEEGADSEILDRLIFDGADIDLGTARWNALRDATRALTRTPMEYDQVVVGKLHSVGFDDAELLDHLYATAFFNWANRLMLSLGHATY